MTRLLAVVAGCLFALGLVISGMTSPARVIGFLDVTGAWDMTLAFVMAAAIATYAAIISARPALRSAGGAAIDRLHHAPPPQLVDARLVIGAAIFGVGWGLSGYCPGPALVSVGSSIETGIFVIALIAGIAIARFVTSLRSSSASRTSCSP